MKDQKMLVIGLTGQTGAGKSTFCRLFAERGAEIINADEVARETIEKSLDCLSDLVLEYSTEVIHPDATLNRQKLSAICFGNKQKLRRLNEITFPYIIDAIEEQMEEAENRNVEMLVLDAPTLYEAGLDIRCDCVIALLADARVRTSRIIERDSLSEQAALQRVNAQQDDAFYRARADLTITNDGDLNALQLAFSETWSKLERFAQGEPLRNMSEIRETQECAETPAVPTEWAEEPAAAESSLHTAVLDELAAPVE